MHALDNPIWNALNTRQQYLAEGGIWAKRFPSQVTALAGFAQPSPEAYAALSRLADGVPAALFLDEPPDLPESLTKLRGLPLVQMIYEGENPSAPRHDWIELGAADVPEMVALAELTKPGPFGTRTYQLGTYLGVGREGKLVAMAGERLRLPGFAEISAVCTHPDHTGQGYAASLMLVLITKMLRDHETPFLHVAGENERAIALYERLGFRRRHEFHLAVVQEQRATFADGAR